MTDTATAPARIVRVTTYGIDCPSVAVASAVHAAKFAAGHVAAAAGLDDPHDAAREWAFIRRLLRDAAAAAKAAEAAERYRAARAAAAE